MGEQPTLIVDPPGHSPHNIRDVLANADHPIAILNLSGMKVTVGFDESDSEPTVYLGFPEQTNPKAFMSPCETHLLIAALGAALCQVAGKAEE
jgi:hypothetical protein